MQNMMVPPAHKAWNKNDFLGYSLNVSPHDLIKSATSATTLAISPSVSGRGVTQGNGTTNGLALFLPHTDIDILVKITVPATTVANAGYFGAWFRSSITGTTNETQYGATIGTNSSNGLNVANVVKYATGFAQNSIAQSGLSKGAKMWMRCGAIGTNIRGKWWMDGSGEPASYQNNWTQTQIASGNYIVLGTYGSSDATNRTTLEYFSYALGASAVAPAP